MIPDHRKHMTEKEWNDPTWQDHLSLAHDQIAEVSTAQGDLKDAQEHYQAALAIRARLAREDETHGKLQEELAATHAKIGSVQVASEDFTAAVASYREAIAIQEHLRAQDPTNARWQKDLAMTYETASNLLRSTGDADGAAAYRAKANRLKSG